MDALKYRKTSVKFKKSTQVPMTRMINGKLKNRKCLHHPAMKCPTPNETGIFTKTEKKKNY